MTGNNARVVLIPNEESIERALLSGEMLRRRKSSIPVLALLSTSFMTEANRSACFARLESVFEAVFIADSKPGEGFEVVTSSLVIHLLKMTMFSKLAVLQPGVLILEQSDDLFNCGSDPGLILPYDNDKGNSEWSVLVIRPNLKKHQSILRNLSKWIIEDEEYQLKKFYLEIFGKNWKGLVGHRVPPFSQRSGQEKILQLESTWEGTYPENISDLDPTILKNITMEDSFGAMEDTKDWIAIVGMSCRFPQANSLEEYWDVLKNGRNTSTPPTEHRLKISGSSNLDLKIKGNYLKCPIDQFDASFFGMSPSEACLSDPQTRLLLEVSFEAFENAGMNTDKLRSSSTGVFLGSWTQEYKEAMNHESSAPEEDYVRKYLANAFGSTASKLSFFYGFTGPNIATESGCSSSMVAVDLACKNLLNFRCPLALAAGSNVIVHLNMKQKVIWSEDAICKTFDSSANGYGRAEGVAVLILKRYSDALRDRDRIHGIIRGTWTSQEGMSRSFGTPTMESEAEAMKGALCQAKVDPSEVSYLEAHATGTSVGDPIEAAAIVQAYRSENEREAPLIIGSGKTNIGHTESCSGMAGIIKVLLAMKHELIPPHINLKSVNPTVDFSSIPGIIPLETVKWPRVPTQQRIAGVSSFGITGTDVHIILQEPPQITSCLESTKHYPQIITWSAKSPLALEEVTNSLVQFLERTPNVNMVDLAYTMNACRASHPFRRSLVVSNQSSTAADLLRLVKRGNWFEGRVKPPKPKICFTFPPGKTTGIDWEPARVIYHSNSYFKASFDKADSVFASLCGTSILPIFLHNTPSTSLEEFKCVEWFACTLTVQYALVQLYKSWGILPDCVIGHCLGEVGAAVVSGAISLEDGFKVIIASSHFAKSQLSNPAEMMAIATGPSQITPLIEEFLSEQPPQTWVDVSNYNCSNQTVVSTPPETARKLKEFLQNKEVKCKRLGIDVSGHSRIIEDSYEESMKAFSDVKHNPCKIPYVSSSTGKITKDTDLCPEFWYKCWRQCVKYISSCETVDEIIQADVYLEVSVEPTLTKFTEDNMKHSLRSPTALFTFHKRGEDGWMGIITTLARLYALGCEVDWDRFYHVLGHQRRVIDLPHYPFQRKSFWFERKRKPQEQTRGLDTPASVISTDIENVHPLLGGILSNALERTIFQGQVSKLSASYIYDHLLGSEVIFPGAAFLEMILAAGYNHFNSHENEGIFLSVENFQVKSALHLRHHGEIKLQTVLERDDLASNTRFAVYAQHGPRWISHATSEFTLTKTEDSDRFNVSDIKDRCNLPLSPDFAEEYYKAFAQVGLNFGPQFHSIRKVYKGMEETLAEVNIPKGSEAYLCHPILIDSIIQTFMLHTKPELRKLHVPVRIGRFRFNPIYKLGQLDAVGFVYCKTESSGLTKGLYLLDKDGSMIASMLNLELATTTVEAIHSSAINYPEEDSNTTTNTPPPPLDIYDTVWKQCHEFDVGGSIESTNDLECGLMSSSSFQNLLRKLRQKNKFSPEEKYLDDGMNRLCYFYVLKCLYDLGWEAKSVNYDINLMAVELGVKPSFHMAFRHFMGYLIEDGDFTFNNQDGTFRLNRKLPEFHHVLEEINKLTSNPSLKQYPSLGVILACSPKLADILRGTVKASQIIFGTEVDGKNLAEIYYETTRFHEGTFETSAEVFAQMMEHIWNKSNKDGEKKIIRILEVGGGTGTFTSRALPKLQKLGVNYHYYFTDISPSFFSKALGKFETYSKRMIFRSLDIGKDLLKQGFPPAFFDIIVGVDVIHATTHLSNTLQNLELLMKDHGRILIGETNKPIREVDISVGLMEGYWIFDDHDQNVRSQGHCTIPVEKWINILEKVGFTKEPCAILSCEDQLSVISAQLDRSSVEYMTRVSQQSGSGSISWIIFYDGKGASIKSNLNNFKGEMEKLGRKVSFCNLQEVLVKPEVQNYINGILRESKETLEGILYWIDNFHGDSIPIPEPHYKYLLEPLLYISKYLQKHRSESKLHFHVATTGAWALEEDEECDPTMALIWGYMRTLRVEMKDNVHSKSIDFSSYMDDDSKVKSLIQELWLTETQFETEVIYRGEMRLVRRLKNAEEGKIIPVPNAERFSVQLPKTKVMSDLSYEVDSTTPELKEDEVEVAIKCASLNFRDVFAVIKPTKYFDQFKTIGLDYAGVIQRTGKNVTRWKVGDAVFGFNWDEGTIKSHLITKNNKIMKLGDSLTFAEGATLPAVFLTAWYCMVNVANLKPGQVVLVHAASGGVGLIAIQIARLLGVKVIGTAGNGRKRRYLRSLGVQHVYSSRSVEFKKQVLNLTGGKGVDMVLNCLTGPGFKEASLEVCTNGGHFIEISKLDVWKPQEVLERRADVHYEIVDVVQVPELIIQEIMGKLTSFLASGKIKPLPYVFYNSERIVDALTFLQRAKHIGKVIVGMPEFQEGSGLSKQYLFNDKSTYLITGGRGSIGLSVAKWMVEQGARYLVLVGRSPPNEEVMKTLVELESAGSTVVNVEANIADKFQCAELLEKIKSSSLGLPPLRGIHHCSGVRSDKLIGNQDWESFEHVLDVKVKGSYNLHVLTKDQPLDFFCLYSSMAATFGNWGQSNYTAGNAYMDSLAQMRRSMGLPAISVNLGHWKGGIAKNVSIPWLVPFSSDQGVQALEHIFNSKMQTSGITSVGRLNWEGLVKMTPFYEKTLLENLKRPTSLLKIPTSNANVHLKRENGGGNMEGSKPHLQPIISENKTVLDYFKELGEDETKKKTLVRGHVVKTLCETLGMNESEIEDDTDFSLMGMDSLLSIEFINKLLSQVGSGSIGFIDVEEHNTITKITEILLTIVNEKVST